MKLSVILPVYRTAVYLPELTRRLTAVLEDAVADYELIYIDDGSPDNAWPVIEALSESQERVVGLHLSRNFGQHPAISAGFEHATGDLIILMDTDLQDRPEAIPELLDALTPEIDAVYTVKRTETEKWSVRLTSRLYHALFSQITRVPIPEGIGTFRLFTRRFLDALLHYPERNVLYGPLMFYAGFRFTTIEVEHAARVGKSSYTFRKRLALALTSLLSYTDLPHRVLMWTGGIILLASLIYALLLALCHLVFPDSAPPGLTLLASLSTGSLGAIMFSLGIIGSYVFRIYEEVLHRPRYLIARTTNVAVAEGSSR